MKTPLTSLLLCSAIACTGNDPSQPTEPVEPATLVYFDDADGVWTGQATTSPFGPMGYGLVVRHEGEEVIARADPPAGAGLPEGAYQQFTFRSAGDSLELHYETQLTGVLMTGTLEAQDDASSDERLYFCAGEASGGCEAMAIDLTWNGGRMQFDTLLGGSVHSSFDLAR